MCACPNGPPCHYDIPTQPLSSSAISPILKMTSPYSVSSSVGSSCCNPSNSVRYFPPAQFRFGTAALCRISEIFYSLISPLLSYSKNVFSVRSIFMYTNISDSNSKSLHDCEGLLLSRVCDRDTCVSAQLHNCTVYTPVLSLMSFWLLSTTSLTGCSTLLAVEDSQ